jgi:hypothetical protein
LCKRPRPDCSLLELLLRRQNRVVPREVLEEKLHNFDVQLASNAMEALVHRLWRKLGDAVANESGLSIDSICISPALVSFSSPLLSEDHRSNQVFPMPEARQHDASEMHADQ